ncbi:cullin-9-like [Gigantopelta aegis]|uniref:cullin-9-like n=1 Tax=Gigantopelta aegis TaxID=1735272 RepID=UPI001B88CE0F|nr:cullin-9-like [Gigantopelta aegis]
MSNNEKGKGLYNVIKSPLSVPITVNLPADNTEPQFLEQTYRENYHEAKTIPRTFIIDISENLKNFLKTSPFFKHISAQDIDVSSYLVFTHTGLCHNEMHAFRVKLNASLNMDVISLNTMYDDESISSISDVIERTLAFYCTLSEDTLSVRKSPLCYQFASPKLSFDLVKSANKWHAEGAFPAGCQFRSELTEQQTENTNICNEDTVFCQICFEEMCVQGGKPFTALSTCKHWFCDGCWRQYLLNSVNYSGLLRIRCPEYGCETVVDITTMLIFLNIRNINHLHQRNVSINVQASQNKKWCPFPDCGRVLVTSATTGDVATVPTSMTCGCGTSLCFKCMQAAHWPASCEQIKLYKEEILKQKDYRKLFYHDEELFEEATTFVEVQGKSCPGCSYFIQKDGGCPYMRCPCGVAFCWSCLQEWYTHNGNKCSETNSSGNTKSFFLDNIDRDKESDISTSTLYRLAVDRRLARHPSTVNKLRSGSRALARSLNDIAAKDVAMRTLIEEKSGSLKIQTTVLNKLYYIMRTILGVKIEVDHVIEFTAVLLLDGTMKRKQQKLLSLMSGLGDISSEFKSILENGKNQKVTYSFTRVFKLQERAGMNIAILSKIIYE